MINTKEKIKKIKKLESQYREMRAKRNHFREKEWKPLFQQIKKLGEAHARPTHSYTGDKHWWLYKYINNSISFSWVDKPKSPKNLKIGQKYYEISQQLSKYGRDFYLSEDALEKAIDSFLWENRPTTENSNQVLKLVINGSGYWYSAMPNEWDQLHWQVITWADDIIEMKL